MRQILCFFGSADIFSCLPVLFLCRYMQLQCDLHVLHQSVLEKHRKLTLHFQRWFLQGAAATRSGRVRHLDLFGLLPLLATLVGWADNYFQCFHLASSWQAHRKRAKDSLLHRKKRKQVIVKMQRASLLGARTLLGAPGLTTRSKKLLGTRCLPFCLPLPYALCSFLRSQEAIRGWRLVAYALRFVFCLGLLEIMLLRSNEICVCSWCFAFVWEENKNTHCDDLLISSV